MLVVSLKKVWGGRWDSNPVRRITNPALGQMSYGHHRNRVRVAPDGTRTRDLSITDRPLSGDGVSPLKTGRRPRGPKAPLSYGRDPHTANSQTQLY